MDAVVVLRYSHEKTVKSKASNVLIAIMALALFSVLFLVRIPIQFHREPLTHLCLLNVLHTVDWVKVALTLWLAETSHADTSTVGCTLGFTSRWFIRVNVNHTTVSPPHTRSNRRDIVLSDIGAKPRNYYYVNNSRN